MDLNALTAVDVYKPLEKEDLLRGGPRFRRGGRDCRAILTYLLIDRGVHVEFRRDCLVISRNRRSPISLTVLLPSCEGSCPVGFTFEIPAHLSIAIFTIKGPLSSGDSFQLGKKPYTFISK